MRIPHQVPKRIPGNSRIRRNLSGKPLDRNRGGGGSRNLRQKIGESDLRGKIRKTRGGMEKKVSIRRSGSPISVSKNGTSIDHVWKRQQIRGLIMMIRNTDTEAGAWCQPAAYGKIVTADGQSPSSPEKQGSRGPRLGKCLD